MRLYCVSVQVAAQYCTSVLLELLRCQLVLAEPSAKDSYMSCCHSVPGWLLEMLLDPVNKCCCHRFACLHCHVPPIINTNIDLQQLARYIHYSKEQMILINWTNYHIASIHSHQRHYPEPVHAKASIIYGIQMHKPINSTMI